ncbi:hypothetical protein [Bauldia sp.]|uniref:hypothetical protein n=1 Tax=Bauldia sp. TaxID=2575872 RepID=UPI003BAC5121
MAALYAIAPVSAQSGLVGIGFAQAEEGTWWCQDSDAATALACAKEQCATESGGQACFTTRWCAPSGWSGLMIVWLPEFHATHVLCGQPGRDAVRDAFVAICLAAPEFSRCDITLMIDPDGAVIDVTETIDPYEDNTEVAPAE